MDGEDGLKVSGQLDIPSSSNQLELAECSLLLLLLLLDNNDDDQHPHQMSIVDALVERLATTIHPMRSASPRNQVLLNLVSIRPFVRPSGRPRTCLPGPFFFLLVLRVELLLTV